MTPIRRGAHAPGAHLRHLSLTVAALAVAAALAAPAREAAAGGAVRVAITAESDTLRADDSGFWNVPVRFTNAMEMGAYVDSMLLEVRDLGPGVTGLPPVTTYNLRQLGASFATVSSGDSVQFTITQAASCERAVLTVRWFGHDGAKVPCAAADSALAGPGEFELAHPSRFVTVGKRRVEIVTFAPPETAKAAPGLLLVHGHGAHARSMLRQASRLANSGWGVVLVSQPGYGLSEGPADFMGPATVGALEAALGVLRTLPRVDPKRLAVWGVSRGATAAMLLAERQPAGLRAVIAQGGLYDPASWFATATPSEAREHALTEAGPAADRWTVRSALAGAARVKADVLLIHGSDDLTSPIAQPRALAAALAAAGAKVDTLFVPGGHQVPRAAASRRTQEFLGRLSSH